MVGLLARTLLLFVLGAGVMLAALRLNLLPTGVLGLAPGQPTASRAASTEASPGGAPVATGAAAAATPLPASTPSVAPASATGIPRVSQPAPTTAALGSATPGRGRVADTANRYLQAWQQSRFPDMYKLLSASARRTIAEDRFLSRYQAITVGAGINAVKTTLGSVAEPASGATTAEAKFTVAFQTARVGDFSEENVLRLVFEENDWRIDWKPDLIFRELTTDRAVRLIPDDPVRGAILDRNGQPLAAQGKIVTLGVVPGRLKDVNKAIDAISKFTAVPPNVIRGKIQAAKPDWWVPFKDYPRDRLEELTRHFAPIDGVIAEEKAARVYPAGAVAAHVTGYLSAVTPEDLRTLAAKGYDEGDLVGRAGVERSAEETLSGQRGGKLLIRDADGETVRTIAERAARNGGTIRLTIDIEIQRKADAVLGEKTGSLVMMDPRDNSITALVSKPAYDPNGFVFGFSDEDWKKLADNPRRPFQERANLSTYPTGSVYKVVTMAAGLEKGGYKSSTMFDCTGQWGVKELNVKKPWGDWVPQGHGRLDLSQGLVESCDIVFYELGHKLDTIDPNLLADYSHQFGLGEPTGIQGLREAEGIVPNPDWKKKALKEEWFGGDAVNMAIGQGYLDATPLQVANIYATLANGGVLRQPLLIRSITPGGNLPPREFQAQERKRVAVSGQNLAIIREALKKVAHGTRGTAVYAFQNPPWKGPLIAAKTGSAENQNPEAHAWFAGFGPADDPKVVVAVMVEGGQSGGSVAAPLGRAAMEIVLGR